MIPTRMVSICQGHGNVTLTHRALTIEFGTAQCFSQSSGNFAYVVDYLLLGRLSSGSPWIVEHYSLFLHFNLEVAGLLVLYGTMPEANFKQASYLVHCRSPRFTYYCRLLYIGYMRTILNRVCYLLELQLDVRMSAPAVPLILQILVNCSE
jgi:hypothetical protein